MQNLKSFQEGNPQSISFSNIIVLRTINYKIFKEEVLWLTYISNGNFHVLIFSLY